MSAAKIITLQDVDIGYGRTVVLPNVSLDFERSDFIGLLGANGSGKTTLLKTLLGIVNPVRGSVSFHAVDGRPPVLGYVPQREALDPVFPLCSLEVVLMGTCGQVRPGRRLGSRERDWALQCLRETSADHLASRRFSQLSGGQKQRVLIARALAARPDILFLDEPTAGIDAAANQSVMELLRRIHQEQKLTIILASHDLTTVRQYVRQVIWIHEGTLVQGDVSELLSREKISEILRIELT